MTFVVSPSLGTIDFVFKIQKKKGFGILSPHLRKTFVKTSEVDQELECEMHQTKYKVMIGCGMD
jgi:hypothetical protein